MQIRSVSNNDINAIVDIHLDAFKGFFLTSLGPAFLRFYYTCFVKSDETVTMVAEEDGTICGFAAATTKCKGFNSRLIKNNLLSFGVLTLKMLFTSPRSLLRLIKNLTKKSESVQDDEDYAELYSIGVSKVSQGRGIGKQLLSATENAIKMGGGERISLTTDYYNNESTVKFYTSMGYSVLYVFTAYPDRRMYRMIKQLSK